jgi:hypothetical protein
MTATACPAEQIAEGIRRLARAVVRALDARPAAGAAARP